MAFCSFTDGAAMFDVTPIENMFLMEYLYDAPAPALRVYLYARMLALHPELGGSMADMALALRMEEREVGEAFDYWEHRGLVARLSDHPATYAFLPVRAQDGGARALDDEMYANRDFNNRLRKLFGDKFIGDHELRKAGDWLSVLKYEPAAALRLIEYGIQTSRSRDPKPPSVFKRMDALAEAWSARGVRTLEDVERAIAEKSGAMTAAEEVLKKLGIARQPSDPELATVTKWLEDWGLTRKEILAACDDTLSARNPTVKYLDSILENRRGDAPEDFRELQDILKELNPQSARPTPDQLRRYDALKKHNTSPEMIRQAAIQCHRANKYRFDDLEWRLNVWREAGIDTPEAAEAWMKEMSALSKQLRGVFRQAGLDDRRPGYGDIAAYRAWRERYPEDVILYAAECSKGAGGAMAYMDKLLKAWAEAGATTVEAARAQREAWRANAASSPDRPDNPALDYAQREYKDEDFGDDFFMDVSKYKEDAQ